MQTAIQNVQTHNNMQIDQATYNSSGNEGVLEIEASEDVLNKIWSGLQDVAAETMGFYHDELADYLNSVVDSIASSHPDIIAPMADWGEYVKVTVTAPANGKMRFQLENEYPATTGDPEPSLDEQLWCM